MPKLAENWCQNRIQIMKKGVQEASKTTQVDQEMPKDRPGGIQETPGSIYSSFKGVLRRQGGKHVRGRHGPGMPKGG